MAVAKARSVSNQSTHEAAQHACVALTRIVMPPSFSGMRRITRRRCLRCSRLRSTLHSVPSRILIRGSPPRDNSLEKLCCFFNRIHSFQRFAIPPGQNEWPLGRCRGCVPSVRRLLTACTCCCVPCESGTACFFSSAFSLPAKFLSIRSHSGRKSTSAAIA